MPSGLVAMGTNFMFDNWHANIHFQNLSLLVSYIDAINISTYGKVI